MAFCMVAFMNPASATSGCPKEIQILASESPSCRDVDSGGVELWSLNEVEETQTPPGGPSGAVCL